MTTLDTFTGIAPEITLDRERRTITGRIVEFDTPTSDYRRIVVHDGALHPRTPLSRVKLLRDHDQSDPVGFMVSMNGDVATFKVPEGENGDRALTEAENGLRDGLSVGFNRSPESGAVTYDEDSDEVHVYSAELVEVSLCAIPAFAGAGVTRVAASHAASPTRPDPKENTTMPADTLTREDFDTALETALERHAEETDRQFASLAARLGDPAPATPTYESFGALVRAAVVDGDKEALEFAQQLAYEGATTDDTNQPNTWIADTIRLIERNRKTLNSFHTEPLPSKGMTLEYLKLETNSMSVAKQDNEGDDLPFGKITLTSDTAAVNTYGGYTQLSRQTIERTDAAYVNTAFRAMDLEYARATEAATRTLLYALIAAQITADNKVTLAATPDVDDWLDLLVDAFDIYEDRGFTLTGAKVSKDVFKQLLRLEDTAGNRLMLVSGQGVNQVGDIDFSKLSAKLGPVRFEIASGAPTGTATFYDPLAITTWESAGAPWMLDQENAINLTKDYSKYGYLAQASQHPDALLPIEFGE